MTLDTKFITVSMTDMYTRAFYAPKMRNGINHATPPTPWPTPAPTPVKTPPTTTIITRLRIGAVDHATERISPNRLPEAALRLLLAEAATPLELEPGPAEIVVVALELLAVPELVPLAEVAFEVE